MCVHGSPVLAPALVSRAAAADVRAAYPGADCGADPGAGAGWGVGMDHLPPCCHTQAHATHARGTIATPFTS